MRQRSFLDRLSIVRQLYENPLSSYPIHTVRKVVLVLFRVVLLSGSVNAGSRLYDKVVARLWYCGLKMLKTKWSGCRVPMISVLRVCFSFRLFFNRISMSTRYMWWTFIRLDLVVSKGIAIPSDQVHRFVALFYVPNNKIKCILFITWIAFGSLSWCQLFSTFIVWIAWRCEVVKR